MCDISSSSDFLIACPFIPYKRFDPLATQGRKRSVLTLKSRDSLDQSGVFFNGFLVRFEESDAPFFQKDVGLA